MEPSDPNGIERVLVALMVPVDLGWSGLRSGIRIFVAAVGRAAAFINSIVHRINAAIVAGFQLIASASGRSSGRSGPQIVRR